MFTKEEYIQALNEVITAVNTQLREGLGNNGIQLRVAKPEDAAACQEIHRQIVDNEGVRIGEGDYAEMMRKENKALLVAVNPEPQPDGTVIGFCGFKLDQMKRWHIDILASSPEKRAEGPIGTALFCATLAFIKTITSTAMLEAAIHIQDPKTKESTYNQQLFDWYEQVFKFHMDDSVAQSLLDITGNMEDLVKMHGLDTVLMQQRDLFALNLPNILDKAIARKRAKVTAQADPMFKDILGLIEAYRHEHPTVNKAGRRSFLNIFADIPRVDKLENLVLEAQQSPNNLPALQAKLQQYSDNPPEPGLKELCDNILRKLPVTSTAHKKFTTK